MTKLAEFALTDPRPALSKNVHATAKAKLIHSLLAGLALGGAARGGVGLYNLVRRNTEKTPKPATATIGFSPEEEDELAKAAGFGDILTGRDAQGVSEIPWFPAAALAAASGGAYGGWKIFDKLMDDRRKAEQEEALETAKLRFNEALQSSTEKYSEDNQLGQELDGLFDQIKEAMSQEKVAETTEIAEKMAFNRTAGKLLGLYGLYALLAGGAAGNFAYNRAKRKTGPEVLDAAMKRRKKIRSLAKPSPVYLTAVRDDDEDEKAPEPPVTEDNGLLGFDSTPTRAIDRSY